MKNKALRREGQLDQVQRSSTKCNSDVCRLHEFFLTEFDELKPCIHSIALFPEINISHSIDYYSDCSSSYAPMI